MTRSLTLPRSPSLPTSLPNSVPFSLSLSSVFALSLSFFLSFCLARSLYLSISRFLLSSPSLLCLQTPSLHFHACLSFYFALIITKGNRAITPCDAGLLLSPSFHLRSFSSSSEQVIVVWRSATTVHCRFSYVVVKHGGAQPSQVPIPSGLHHQFPREQVFQPAQHKLHRSACAKHHRST